MGLVIGFLIPMIWTVYLSIHVDDLLPLTFSTPPGYTFDILFALVMIVLVWLVVLMIEGRDGRDLYLMLVL